MSNRVYATLNVALKMDPCPTSAKAEMLPVVAN